MYRGYKIELLNNVYVYSDSKQPVSENKQRKCGKCNLEQTEDGHDGCLGKLPGLMNACCGHGHDKPYVQFMDGFVIKGNDAKIVIKILKLTKHYKDGITRIKIIQQSL